jgi:hypothetical protein
MTVYDGDVLRVTVKCEAHGKDVQNVFHYRADLNSDDSNGLAKAAIWGQLADAYNYVTPYQTDELTGVEIEFFNITQDEPMGTYSVGTNLDGESTSEEMPPAVAGMTTFRTLSPSSLGRKFIGGLVKSAAQADGSLTTAFQTALADFASEFLTGVTSGAGEYIAGNWNKDLARFAEWVGAQAISTFKTQRRRYLASGS